MTEPGSRSLSTRPATRERQVEFPREQSHDPIVTTVLLGVSLACIVIVLVLLVADVEGPFIGPW